MKEKLEQIFNKHHYGYGEYNKDEIIKELLVLYNVVGQSGQCTHENEVQRQGDGFVYTVCSDCGEDLD
jgi:hypothetical protein